MERTQRLILLAVAIGWTIFRLVRHVRLANPRRPAPAIPPARPPATATSQSPIEPAGRAAGALTGNLVAAGILVAGNALLWPLLFALPAFEDVPTVWRLVAGVLVNLVLIRVAGGAAARVTNRSQPGADDDRNPIK